MTRGSLLGIGLLTSGLWSVACAPPAPRTLPPSGLVSVNGIVFDSIARTPLSDARIAFTRSGSPASDVAHATTDAKGAFAIALPRGTWRAALEHPRLDSLRVVVSLGRIVLGDSASVDVRLGTDLPGAITRALCGANVRNDDVAIAGRVRNAATGAGVDSAGVFVKWVDVQLSGRGFTRSAKAVTTRSNRDGWYVRCDIPAAATIVSWAARGGATTGASLLTLTGAPSRLDFTIDTTARPAAGSVDPDPDSDVGSLFPMSVGTVRYHVIVRDLDGRPVTNARVRILGRNAVRSDASGAVTIDSIARGTQTVEVSAIGFRPERRNVELAGNGEPADTVVLASLKSVLSTVTITAGRDPSGFELRRGTREGQFITAADIARANPARITQLLRTKEGLRYSFDPRGFASLEVTTMSTPCHPFIVVDGFPPDPGVPGVPGEAVLDWIAHPDEIGGIEIYNNFGQVPPEIAKLAPLPPCAAIVIWTKERLGLPAPRPQR